MLENPNDRLPKPAVLQHAARVLTGLGWQPRAIANLIYGCYTRRGQWGDQWVRLDPVQRALFYTRLFTGLISMGADKLIYLNLRVPSGEGLLHDAGLQCELAWLSRSAGRREDSLSDRAFGLSTGCFWQTSISDCLEEIRNSGFGRTEICSNPNHLDYHDRDKVQQAARLAEELGPGDVLKRPAHPQ